MTRRTHWLKFPLGSALLFAALSCSKTEEHPAPAAPLPPSSEITSGVKGVLGITLTFAIKLQDMTADGSRVIQVRGTYQGAEVGLIVVLGPKWEAVTPESKSKSSFAFHTGTVEFRTIGDPSNTLLNALDELFATKLNPHPMRPDAKFAGTSLQGDPGDLGKGEVRLKLVSDAKDPERQAELYTDIDLQKHVLHISVKDAAKYKALLLALQRD